MINNRNNISSRNGNATTTTTTTTTTTQACAACKYQRRKCGPNCILAPYFPHDRQKQFLNAHKLFGVGKITNMIKNVEPPHLRDTTMSTIIFQSDMRAADPVGGCYSLIQQLHSQIEYLNAELHFTLQQLAIFRASSSSSQQLLNVNHYHDNIIINNNNINIDNNADHHASLLLPPPSNAHYHYVEQLPPPQHHVEVEPSSYINPNDIVPLQEDLNLWANSIPLLSPDKKEDGEERGFGDENIDDQKPVLDLINELNLDTTRSIHPGQ